MPTKEIEGYYSKRKLSSEVAGTFQLAAFSIGIGISGEYFGWNAGLEYGWNNMLIAVSLAAIMYSGLILSVCELCCALPFTNGPGIFAQASFNVWLGAFVSMTYALNYCLLASTLMIAITKSLFPGWSFLITLLCWLVLFSLTFLIQSFPKWFFKLICILALYGSIMLMGYMLFTLCFLASFDASNDIRTPTKSMSSSSPSVVFFNSSSSLSSSSITTTYSNSLKNSTLKTMSFTHDVSLDRILAGYPYACWFFIGLEAFSTTAEEVHKIIDSAPKASIFSYIIIVIFALTILSSSPNNNSTFVSSIQPLIDDFLRMTQFKLPSPILPVLNLICLVPSLLGAFWIAIYAASRHLYTLSRAGILPTQLSYTTRQGAPWYSIMLSLISVGMIVLITDVMERSDWVVFTSFTTHAVTLKFSIWFASIGYVIACGSYIMLHLRRPMLPRPFVSPLSIHGACISLLISLTLGVLAPFYLELLFYSLLALAFVISIAVFTLYYFLIASTRLIEAHEKLFVLRQIRKLYKHRNVSNSSSCFTTVSDPNDFARFVSEPIMEATKLVSTLSNSSMA